MENKETKSKKVLADATAKFETDIKTLSQVFMRNSSEDSRQTMRQCLRNYLTLYLMDCRGFSTTDINCALNKLLEYAE